MDATILARENARLSARLAEVEAQLAEVRGKPTVGWKIFCARHERFGKSSEKLSPDQFNLPLEDIELAHGVLEAAQEKAEAALRAAKDTDEPRKPARNRGHLSPHLPRIERVIEPASTQCPCGCGEMVKIGEDVSERLDVIPAQFRVLVTRRPKYACRRCSQGMAQAHAPEHVVPGGLPQRHAEQNLHRQAGLNGRIAVVGLAAAFAGRCSPQVMAGSIQIVSEPRRLSAAL